MLNPAFWNEFVQGARNQPCDQKEGQRNKRLQYHRKQPFHNRSNLPIP